MVSRRRHNPVREHVAVESGDSWTVVAKGAGVDADAVVAAGLPETVARKRAIALNAAQFRPAFAPEISATAHTAGCTCAAASGGIPGAARRCPVVGHS